LKIAKEFVVVFYFRTFTERRLYQFSLPGSLGEGTYNCALFSPAFFLHLLAEKGFYPLREKWRQLFAAFYLNNVKRYAVNHTKLKHSLIVKIYFHLLCLKFISSTKKSVAFAQIFRGAHLKPGPDGWQLPRRGGQCRRHSRSAAGAGGAAGRLAQR
jgi:hypothetical protein